MGRANFREVVINALEALALLPRRCSCPQHRNKTASDALRELLLPQIPRWEPVLRFPTLFAGEILPALRGPALWSGFFCQTAPNLLSRGVCRQRRCKSRKYLPAKLPGPVPVRQPANRKYRRGWRGQDG